MVTIRVGSDEQHTTIFTAHRDVLIKSRFFAACLQEGRFQEGLTGEVTLPEEAPENVNRLLGWLYTGKASDRWPQPLITLRKHGLHIKPQQEIVGELVDDCTLADRYLLDDVRSALIGRILSSAPYLTREHLQTLEESGIQGSQDWQAIIVSLGKRMYDGYETSLDDLMTEEALAENGGDEMLRQIENVRLECEKYHGGASDYTSSASEESESEL
jgi:hypothetical protein